MRVAFVSFDFGEYSIRLASALATNAEVALFLPNDQADPHRHLIDSRINFQPFSKARLRNPFQQTRMALRLLNRIYRFKPDVVHVQQGHMWFNLALPALRRFPLVMTVHDPQHHIGDKTSQKTPQRILHFGFRQADRIIVHAASMKKIAIDRCGFREEIVDIVPHVAIGSRPKECSQDDECSVLFFGRIWPYKGLEYLIQAEPLITREVPSARIVIAGEGENFERYRRMMAHPERFVVHNEYISENKCSELFRRSAVVVLPYIEASQSGVLALAYTSMRPVVATTVGGLPEMVDHGQTGYLVPPRNPDALAQAIIRLLKDRQLREQFGTAARRKITNECAPSVIAEKTLRVYRHAISAMNPSCCAAPLAN